MASLSSDPTSPGRGRGSIGASVVSTTPTVLVADGPHRASRYEQWLEPVLTVLVASRPSEVLDRVDSDLDVVVLGEGVSEDSKIALLKTVSMRCPFARVIVIPEDDQPPMLEGVGYDRCLYRPIDRSELRTAVKRLARIALYERTVSTYFEYTTLVANQRVGGDEAALEEDDVRSLEATVDRLKARLRRMRSSIDDADRELLFDSLSDAGVPQFGGTVERTTSKRQPDDCTSCGLDWTVEHGGYLGHGCERLGAFVWKCTRCGTVQQAPDPSHQRVA